jgi:hypothetical protein
MVNCKECGAATAEGALFCDACGAFLLERESAPAATIEEDSTRTMVPVAPMPALPRAGSEPSPFADESDLTPPPALVGQDMAASVEARQLSFVIPTSGRRHTVEIKDEIHVGRADPGSGYLPELDLTVDDGVQKGVSRRHAVIQRSSRGILLVDLNSTNGTSLNNFRIPPDLPYPLNNGDEVRFGQLLVHVFLS